MSANRSNTYSKNSTALNKFCKVCQDKGLPESVYRSHYTRETPDPLAKVCCPTLLALECRYCGANGHTVKYCAVLKDRERVEKRAVKTEMRQSHQQQNEKRNQSPVQDKKPKNAFAVLYEDDEPVQVEVEETVQAEVEVKVEVFGPSLCSKVTESKPAESNVTESKPVLGYAAAVNKKPVEPWMKNLTVKIEPKKAITNEKQWAPLSKTSVNVDWAADSESDEDW